MSVVVRFLLGCGVGLAQWGYWVVVSCLFGVCSCVRLCLVKGVLGESVCWRVWLFGCGVCCWGWRVARVVG